MNNLTDYKKNNLCYIDILKAVACLGVYNSHYIASFCNDILVGCMYNVFWKTPIVYLIDGPINIIIFYVISGFLIAYTNLSEDVNYENMQLKLIKRTMYMYLPCLLVCFVMFFIMQLKMVYVSEAFHWGGKEYLYNLFSFNPTIYSAVRSIKGVVTGVTPYAPQLWTMKYEFICGTTCFIIMFLSGKKKSVRWFLYAGIIFGSIYKLDENFFECFILGMIAWEICLQIKPVLSKIKKYIWGVLGFICLWMGVILRNLKYGKYIYPIAIMFVLIFWYCAFHEQCVHKRLLAHLSKIGKYSFGIYIIHFMIIATYSSFVFVLGKKHGANENLIYGFGVLSTFVLVYLLFYNSFPI